MAKKTTLDAADFIVPLLINGLQGRMLALPHQTRKSEVLAIYGHHGSLEKWWPLALELSRYGSVTIPDLPGFGGMQSFYRIGRTPTLDNLADYLAAFIKLRYKRKRVIIVGIAFGFVVVTRMLERSPDLARKVDVLISVGGFTRSDDIKLSPRKRFSYRFGGRALSMSVPALFVKYLCFDRFILRKYYERIAKLKSTAIIDQEVRLWRLNDTRTHFRTMAELTTFDNCRAHVSLPLVHVPLRSNRYLNYQHTKQHLHVIYSDVIEVPSRIKSQAIGTVEYNASTTNLLPAAVHNLLKLSVKAKA